MIFLFDSERLYFREWNEQDAEWVKELNDNPKVVQYTGDVPFDSLEATRLFLRNYLHYSEYGFGRWAVHIKSTGQPVGWCGLKFNEENMVDIGFRFFEEFWGMGFATEAAKACIDHGFTRLHLDCIVGRTAAANQGALNVLDKIGMDFWKKGEVHGIEDVRYFRIFNKSKE